MLEDKTPIESYHIIVKAHALSLRGYLEVCDYFDEEKDKNNLNLDEKIIIANCIRTIHLASATDEQKEIAMKRRYNAESFYLDNYDKCAPGTRDYMAAYEEKLRKEREMFKDLDAFVERQNKSLQKTYTYKK